jgi:hypothetical protein
MERPVVDEAEVFLREEKSGGGGDPAPPAEEAKEDRREGGFIEPEAEVRVHGSSHRERYRKRR